ncbi:transcription factor IIIB 50 kDa subunit [Lingula anatina]|uniref:Transcription factor IIIB 50 kDa subunit n=1 Tax=Lingula anatina TaxID=7574 RepID=A0A1S3JWE8_LINAN|nr:transcription factor IIIB 50 kDa subunit [Lingula anatina]|eukprot:XP_013414364.1 transcription factor IIIB 50 kDa subunit [Lingula anatina]
MDSQLCDNCGKNSLITDDHGGCSQLVCEDCGTVKAQGGFQAPPEQTVWSNKSDIFWNSSKKLQNLIQHHGDGERSSEGKKIGEKRIKEISAAMNLSSDMKESALDMYNKLIHRSGPFRGILLANKLVLASAAVYVVCRQRGWPVTLNSTASLCQCSVFDLGKYYKEILKVLNITLEAQDIVDLIPSCLSSCNFSDTELDEVTRLVELCKETWISSGRRYNSVITAAAYLVWQSHNVKELKTPICRFVSTFKLLQWKYRLKHFVEELKTVLCALAEGVPWLSDVKPDKVHLHLPDILKYQKSLLATAISLQQEDREGAELLDGDTEQFGYHGKRKGGSAIFPTAYKKARLHSEQDDSCSRESISVSSHSNLDCEFLTEEDIPENELREYIKDKDEILKLQAADHSNNK